MIRCTVGVEQFAFRRADVRHVARVEQMRSDTGPDGRVGSLRVPGQTVPVFGLGRVLGLHTTASVSNSTDQHIAVTGDPGELVGWLVDRIVREALLESTNVVSLPEITGALAATWFEALVNLGETSVLLLAPQYLNPLAERPAGPEATAAFHAKPPRIDGQAEPMVVFFSTSALPRCDARRYALSARQIAAIVQPVPLITVPGSARYVTGVTWWREAVVPVIDFRDPGDRDEAPRGRCLIARCAGRLRGTLVAFSIGSEIEVHRPAAGDQRLTGVPCPAFAAGMFGVAGETVALLDLDALLASDANRAGAAKVGSTFAI